MISYKHDKYLYNMSVMASHVHLDGVNNCIEKERENDQVYNDENVDSPTNEYL